MPEKDEREGDGVTDSGVVLIGARFIGKAASAGDPHGTLTGGGETRGRPSVAAVLAARDAPFSPF
jgi:hypothetical protein